MSIDGSINGAPVNELEVNGSGYEEVKLPLMLAEIVLTGSMDASANETISPGLVAEMVITGYSGETINPSSEGVAGIELQGVSGEEILPTVQGSLLAEVSLEGQEGFTLNPSSEGVAFLTLDGHEGFTLNGSSAGVAGITLGSEEGFTLNSSSAGVAEMDLLGMIDITVSGGKGATGIAEMTLDVEMAPYIWTYFYPSGMAEMALEGQWNPRYRPPVPQGFQALGALEVMVVAEDGTLSPVEGPRRLEVPADDATLGVDEEESLQ